MVARGSVQGQEDSGATPPSRAAGEPETLTAVFNWDYLIECFANEKVCISFGLWIFSVLFWMSSHALLWYLRCRKRSGHSDSVLLVIYSFLGSLCNTVGALLAKQLTIQVFTGAYMATMDLLKFILILFPVGALKSNPKPRSGSLSKQRKLKHRTSTFAVFLPFAVGAGYYCWAAPAFSPSADFHSPGRRLLGKFLQNNTEIIGYALGITAVIICWTSKFPLISRAYRGKVFPGILLWSHGFSVLASVLYAAAIMGHDKQPEYILQAIPWFLLSLGSAALDTAILLLSCLMKWKFTQQLGLTAEVLMPDAEALLEESELDTEDEDTVQSAAPEDKNSSWMPLNIVPNNRCPQKTATIGHYVDMSIEPVQEWDFETETERLNMQHELQNGFETSGYSIQPNDSSVLSATSELDNNISEQSTADFQIGGHDPSLTEEKASVVLTDNVDEVKRNDK